MNAAARPLRAALLTPLGRGAVAVVALQGDGAAAIVARHFISATGATPSFPLNRIRFGRWHATHKQEAEQREELVVCRRGEDRFEIHCHGGEAASAAILAGLQSDGAAIITWQQWFTDDDPIAVEAQTALAATRTARTASIVLDQAAGALRRTLDETTRLIESGDRRTALTLVDRLLARARLGRRLTEPFRVVLCGRPNVGKSSLLNALLGYRRAVVYDLPGTTRDVVTAATVVEGWPIELSDTAGLRTTSDELENAGVAAARRSQDQADLVLAVFDLTEPWTPEDAAILASQPQAVVVLNKADAAEMAAVDRPRGIRTSAVSGLGIDVLLATIAERLVPDPPQPGEAVPFTTRQENELRRLRDVLQS